MPRGLYRFHQTGDFHFITFSCYQRRPGLHSAPQRDCFEGELEQVRRRYGLAVSGYVVMPEHIHLLLSEPETGLLAGALQVLKQQTSRQLKSPGQGSFWHTRYYDFNVWSGDRFRQKLRYIHRNPVTRGLVARPESWRWSSYQHYAEGVTGAVEIESERTARSREQSTSMLSHP